METKDIKGVEIFSEGTWNGDEYTADHLQEMVKAYNENKDTLKPFLKFGHDDGQGLIQRDGYPAIGWISNLYIKGKKLLADFEKVPAKVFELLKSGAYRKVSSEIYWNIKIGEKTYGKFLSAVSLLGADMPAVTNLSDIVALYGLADIESLKKYVDNDPNAVLKSYDYKNKELAVQKSENEIKLELELKQMTQKIADQEKLTKENADLEKKTQDLEAKNKEYSLKIKDAEDKAKKAETEKFVETLSISKAVKPLIYAFVSGETKVGDKDYTKETLIKEILELQKKASEVNLDEDSDGGQNDNNMESKIQAYMKENKVDYGKAYREVLRKEAVQ